MKLRELMYKFDQRFNSMVIDLATLGKEYGNIKITLKVMRTLPREWDVKKMVMRKLKDLKKLKLHDLFADIKIMSLNLKP